MTRSAGRQDRALPSTLLFLPGFMIAAPAYDALLQPVQVAGWQVVVPQLYPRGVSALLGRHSVTDEAREAAKLVHGRCVIAGHSRGGQAAWLAAGMADVAGVVLIDPVDAQGRRPDGPTSTRSKASFTCPCLIVGARLGGRCAPEGVNHVQFAQVTPQAEHVIVDDLGHADMLSGRPLTFGRRVCGGGADPVAAREHVSGLMVAFLAALPDGPGRASTNA